MDNGGSFDRGKIAGNEGDLHFTVVPCGYYFHPAICFQSTILKKTHTHTALAF